MPIKSFRVFTEEENMTRELELSELYNINKYPAKKIKYYWFNYNCDYCDKYLESYDIIYTPLTVKECVDFQITSCLMCKHIHYNEEKRSIHFKRFNYMLRKNEIKKIQKWWRSVLKKRNDAAYTIQSKFWYPNYGLKYQIEDAIAQGFCQSVTASESPGTTGGKKGKMPKGCYTVSS